MNHFEKRRYIGHTDQLLNLKTFRYCGGKAEGTLATEIHNGADLDVTVAADRCMDLYRVVFRGVNMSYIGSCGVVHPAYYDAQGDHFHKSFTAGLMTTCGLDHFGAVCVDQGKELGQHGEVGNLPAEQYRAWVEEKDGLTAYACGTMKQTALFAENLELERRYEIREGVNEIRFEDTVTNRAYRPQEFMQLYHFNYGYPFLTEEVQIYLPSLEVRARDEAGVATLASWNRMEAPADGVPERCYFHTMGMNPEGRSAYTVYNPRLAIGVYCEFDASVLDHFIQWKSIASGEYVLGLEPANALVIGRDAVRRSGELKYLQPQQRETHRFLLRFFQGEDGLNEALAQQAEMKLRHPNS